MWEEGLPTDVDRFLLHSSGSWIKLYLKKTRLHKPRSCHHVYASLGWTLTLAAKRPHSFLGAVARLAQACPWGLWASPAHWFSAPESPYMPETRSRGKYPLFNKGGSCGVEKGPSRLVAPSPSSEPSCSQLLRVEPSAAIGAGGRGLHAASVLVWAGR